MFLVNALSTQMARFLLPVFPIALALAFSGAAAAVEKGWRLVRAGCFATLGVFLVFCAAADGAGLSDRRIPQRCALEPPGKGDGILPASLLPASALHQRRSRDVLGDESAVPSDSGPLAATHESVGRKVGRKNARLPSGNRRCL